MGYFNFGQNQISAHYNRQKSPANCTDVCCDPLFLFGQFSLHMEYFRIKYSELFFYLFILTVIVSAPFFKLFQLPVSVKALEGMLLIHTLSWALTFSDGKVSPLLWKSITSLQLICLLEVYKDPLFVSGTRMQWDARRGRLGWLSVSFLSAAQVKSLAMTSSHLYEIC